MQDRISDTSDNSNNDRFARVPALPSQRDDLESNSFISNFVCLTLKNMCAPAAYATLITGKLMGEASFCSSASQFFSFLATGVGGEESEDRSAAEADPPSLSPLLRLPKIIKMYVICGQARKEGSRIWLAGWLAGCTRISISIPLQPASLLSLSPPCSFSTSHSALDIELLCTTSDQLLGNVLELDWLLGAQKRNSKIQIRLHLTSHDMLLFGRRRFKGSKVQRLQSR